jgi:hypothetical protein
VAAISSDAIGSALTTIKARLAEVEQQIEMLAQERQALERAEQSLLVIAGEGPSPPAEMATDAQPAQPRRRGSLRSQLQAALKEAGPSGQTIQQLRTMFPETKGTTLAATLSNLKRAGVLDTKEGRWVCRQAPWPEYSSTGGADIANMGDEPERLHNVSERDYEIVTHPRTGVSLARRA